MAATTQRGLTAWTIVPGLAGVVVMISTLMLGALTLVRERERGSWEMLLATPVDASDAMLGKLSPYVISVSRRPRSSSRSPACCSLCRFAEICWH